MIPSYGPPLSRYGPLWTTMDHHGPQPGPGQERSPNKKPFWRRVDTPTMDAGSLCGSRQAVDEGARRQAPGCQGGLAAQRDLLFFGSLMFLNFFFFFSLRLPVQFWSWDQLRYFLPFRVSALHVELHAFSAFCPCTIVHHGIRESGLEELGSWSFVHYQKATVSPPNHVVDFGCLSFTVTASFLFPSHTHTAYIECSDDSKLASPFKKLVCFQSPIAFTVLCSGRYLRSGTEYVQRALLNRRTA